MTGQRWRMETRGVRDVMVQTGRAATLAEFVSARLDETTALAVLVRSDIEEESVEDETSEGVRALADFVVADCEAKRRIVEQARGIPDGNDPAWRYADGIDAGRWTALDDVLKILAQPYVDHPDFRDEWRLP